MATRQASCSNPPRRDARDACDRCHSLKTRCDRLPGSTTCQRCSRLGLLCAYSPPLRLGRPQRNRTAAAESSSVGTQRQQPQQPVSPVFPGQGSQTKHKRRRTNSRDTNQDTMVPYEHWPGAGEADEADGASETGEAGTRPPHHGGFSYNNPYSSKTSASEPGQSPSRRASVADSVPSSTEVFSHPPQSLGSGGSAMFSHALADDHMSMFHEVDFDFAHPHLGDLLSAEPTNLLLQGMETGSGIARGHAGDLAIDIGMPQVPVDSDNDNTTHCLWDIQLRLLRLQKSFKDAPNVSLLPTAQHQYGVGASVMSEGVEGLYIATEDFLETLAKLPWHTGEGIMERGTEFPKPRLHVSTVLLLSSCYTRFVHVYELLIMKLRAGSGQSASNSSASSTQSSAEESVFSGPSLFSQGDPSLSPKGAHHQQHRREEHEHDLPSFQIGRYRLTMPLAMNRELHLHVVTQMAQRLKGAMQMLWSNRTSGQGNLMSSVGSKGDHGKIGDSVTVAMETVSFGLEDKSRNPASALVEMAASEVNECEEKLAQVLQKPHKYDTS